MDRGFCGAKTMVESVRQFIRLTVVLTFYLTGATSWATEHWAFVRPRRASLPTIEQQDWPRGAIDHFVAARLQQADLLPSSAADRHTLIRRLTFDLTGLPPTRAEVQQFVYDNRPDAYNHLVDRLLASPRFGEHWAVPWL